MDQGRKALQSQLLMMSLVGQILDADLEPLLNLPEEPVGPPGFRMSSDEYATMQEGQDLARKLVVVLKAAQDELRPLEGALSRWNPPPRIMDEFMKKGPPEL